MYQHLGLISCLPTKDILLSHIFSLLKQCWHHNIESYS